MRKKEEKVSILLKNFKRIGEIQLKDRGGHRVGFGRRADFRTIPPSAPIPQSDFPRGSSL